MIILPKGEIVDTAKLAPGDTLPMEFALYNVTSIRFFIPTGLGCMAHPVLGVECVVWLVTKVHELDSCLDVPRVPA